MGPVFLGFEAGEFHVASAACLFLFTEFHIMVVILMGVAYYKEKIQIGGRYESV